MNAIRVIFVDDEPRVLEGLKRMLRPKRNEWQMTFVGSAQAALDALQAEPCEVVVTDMRMPGMNGAELLEVVQREYPDTIRLILSGQAETESVMKALGVSHQFLSKPCDAEILQGTIAAPSRCAISPATSRSRPWWRASTNYRRCRPPTRGWSKPEEPEPEHGRRGEDHLHRSGDDRAPAQAGELGLLRPAEAGGRRGARRRPARPGSHHGAGARPGNLLRLRSAARCEGFSMEALWPHSVATAAAAHRIAIAEHLDKDLVAAAFLAGMLHDIGKLVLAMGMPEQYAQGAQAGGGRPGATCRDRNARTAAPRTPTWAPTWWACGACLTPSPRPSPITRIRRSRELGPSACRASCTWPTAWRTARTSPICARPSSG